MINLLLLHTLPTAWFPEIFVIKIENTVINNRVARSAKAYFRLFRQICLFFLQLSSVGPSENGTETRIQQIIKLYTSAWMLESYFTPVVDKI